MDISKMKTVPAGKFKDAFKRTDWEKIESGSDFEKWVFKKNTDIWTVVPVDESSREYLYYQQKNIKLLLFALDIKENSENFFEIYNQLIGYNYKLINRIVNNVDYLGDAIPFEIANGVPEKNINSFRFFYTTKRGKFIPIENFEFNHTQKGSFIIPISVIAEKEENKLWKEPSPTNKVIREYLDTIHRLLQIREDNEEKFADKAIDQQIDSRMIKSFLSESIGIAKYIKKYESSINEISITSNGSPFLDFNLSDNEKTFKKIELKDLTIVPDRFIEYLEKKEDESNEETIEESGVTVDVIVDSITSNGKAQFTVVAINKKPVKKAFVAISHRLTKARINFCADSLKSQDIVEVEGDVFKAKGKTGEITLDDIKETSKTQSLFEEDDKNS